MDILSLPKTADTAVCKKVIEPPREICEAMILSFSQKASAIISDISPRKDPCLEFTARELIEIQRHLTSYTDRIFISEAGGGVCFIVPSLYPASGLAPAFFFKKSNAVLRLLRECDSELYAVSPHIKPKTVRISSVDKEFADKFFSFFQTMHDIFFCVDLDINLLDGDERRRRVLRQCSRISRFTGCSIELSVSAALENATVFPKLDFQLFSAYMLTVLYSAKRRSKEQKVYVALDILSNSLLIETSFNLCRKAPRYPELAAWEHLAYDKNMLFERSCTENIMKIRFNPIRADWSLLGIKQKTK